MSAVHLQVPFVSGFLDSTFKSKNILSFFIEIIQFPVSIFTMEDFLPNFFKGFFDNLLV